MVSGKNVNNLRYADDTVLIAENEKDLQALLDIIERDSLNKGLELNGKKNRSDGNQPKSNRNVYYKRKRHTIETARNLQVSWYAYHSRKQKRRRNIVTNSPSDNNFPKASTVSNQQQHNAREETESPSMLYPTDLDVRV